MVPELVVRADAGAAVGAGHVMRCIALAEAWRALGGRVTFVSSCEGELLRKRVEGFGLIEVPHPHPDPRDAALLADALAVRPGAKLVIDGYAFDAVYQERARAGGRTVLVIDDIGHMPRYSADLILNQNIGAKDVRYGDGAQLLLGPKYALLRPEFAPFANLSRTIPDRARNILVTLGGSDPDNFTAVICHALAAVVDRDIVARVVLGESNRYGDSLRASARDTRGRIEIVAATDRMPELMASADIAICAGGSTCWELAFLGVPAIVVVLAENQRENARRLERTGAAIDLSYASGISSDAIGRAVTALIDSASRRTTMSNAGRTLIDGRGARRAALALLGRADDVFI